MPAFAADEAQLSTGTFGKLFGVHVVVTQLLPEAAAAATQFCTPVGPLVIAAGQVTLVQLLPTKAAEAVQV